jgi:hypothetical protein
MKIKHRMEIRMNKNDPSMLKTLPANARTTTLRPPLKNFFACNTEKNCGELSRDN